MITRSRFLTDRIRWRPIASTLLILARHALIFLAEDRLALAGRWRP